MTTDLNDVDVPVFGLSSPLLAPGDGDGVAVLPGLQYHVLAGVGATEDGGRGSVRGGGELVLLALAPAVGVGVQDGAGAGLTQAETLKVESDLTDVTGGFADFEGAGRESL